MTFFTWLSFDFYGLIEVIWINYYRLFNYYKISYPWTRLLKIYCMHVLILALYQVFLDKVTKLSDFVSTVRGCKIGILDLQNHFGFCSNLFCCWRLIFSKFLSCILLIPKASRANHGDQIVSSIFEFVFTGHYHLLLQRNLNYTNTCFDLQQEKTIKGRRISFDENPLTLKSIIEFSL